MNVTGIFAVSYSFLLLLFLLASCADSPAPRITLSREKTMDRGSVELKGIGFTPNASVISHMRRPDGTDFPTIRFLTDNKGEFTHLIDTSTLFEGKHEIWVDDPRGVSSNIATFEVVNEQSK